VFITIRINRNNRSASGIIKSVIKSVII
jgi:hypothetical protein